MAIFILILIILAALLAIASGIWVAIALGSAISKDGTKKMSTDVNDT